MGMAKTFLFSGLFGRIFSFTALATLALAQTCYFPDTSKATDYIPCSGSGDLQTCCQPGATCLSTGLCFLGTDHGINTGSCTDRGWSKASGCFQSCLDITGRIDTNSVIFRCGHLEWCCNRGGNGTSCCSQGPSNRFTLSQPAQVLNGSNFAAGYTILSSADLATPPTISPAAATSCTTACTATSISATGSDKVTAVGAGVGLGVGIPLLAALLGVVFLWLREKRVVEGLRTKHNNQQVERKCEGDYELHPQYIHPPQELELNTGAKELSTSYTN